METQAERYIGLMPELEEKNTQVSVLFDDNTGIIRSVFNNEAIAITWAYVEEEETLVAEESE